MCICTVTACRRIMRTDIGIMVRCVPLIGMAHGLAGSAALMLIVLSTVTGFGQGIGYIVVFGVGSILGMVGVGAVLSLPVIYSVTVGPKAYWMVQGLVCLASIGLGLLMMVRIGLGSGWS